MKKPSGRDIESVDMPFCRRATADTVDAITTLLKSRVDSWGLQAPTIFTSVAANVAGEMLATAAFFVGEDFGSFWDDYKTTFIEAVLENARQQFQALNDELAAKRKRN